MRFYWLALGILGAWRVTHLLNAEDGPADVLVRLRRSAGTGFWGSLLDCFYCLSLWVAAPFALLLGEDWKERALLWLAISAAAILLERATARPPQAIYHEDSAAAPPEHNENGEDENVLLRKEQGPVSGGNARAAGRP